MCLFQSCSKSARLILCVEAAWRLLHHAALSTSTLTTVSLHYLDLKPQNHNHHCCRRHHCCHHHHHCHHHHCRRRRHHHLCRHRHHHHHCHPPHRRCHCRCHCRCRHCQFFNFVKNNFYWSKVCVYVCVSGDMWPPHLLWLAT